MKICKVSRQTTTNCKVQNLCDEVKTHHNIATYFFLFMCVCTDGLSNIIIYFIYFFFLILFYYVKIYLCDLYNLFNFVSNRNLFTFRQDKCIGV